MKSIHCACMRVRLFEWNGVIESNDIITWSHHGIVVNNETWNGFRHQASGFDPYILRVYALHLNESQNTFKQKVTLHIKCFCWSNL